MTTIVLEGPDGGGKTTLKDFLCKRLRARSVHMSIPEPLDKPLDYWMGRLREAEWPEIIDRLHWSEDVYANLFRGGSRLSDLDRWLLEGWLIAHSAVIVLCRPSRETVLKNTALEPENMHHDVSAEVYDGFGEPWGSLVPRMFYDYERESAYELLCRLPTEDGLPFRHEGIGSPNPEVVFVGDRHGGCDGPCGDPLVFRSPCGDYLRQALDYTGMDLSEYHVLNGWVRGRAVEVYPHPGLMTFKPRVFVAMGEEAGRALSELGVEYQQVPHPQYMKRFHARDVEAYGAMLKKAATGQC